MCGSGRDEEPSGGKALRLIQIRLTTLNFEKISPARQGNLPQMRTATSSSQAAFHLVHNETLSASICVSNRDRPRAFLTFRRLPQVAFSQLIRPADPS